MAETNYDERVIVDSTSTAANPYTLEENKTYTAAAYEGNGGAFYLESGGTVTGKKVTFQDNSVTASDGQGGAIFINSGATLSITEGTFTSNTAPTPKTTSGGKGQGGAIYNGGTATLTNCTVSSNKATMGGAVFNSAGSLTIIGGTFSTNSAKYGGAIQNFKGGVLTITNTAFTSNSAGADGGAISHDSGTATITGATFTGNSSKENGGAICNKSTLILSDVTFSGNTATKVGGAIYNTGTVNMTGTVTLATETDVFYNTGTVSWDLSGGTTSYGSLVGYQYLTNDGGTLAITVGSNQEAGTYILATGDFSNIEGKNTFTIGESTVTINGDSVEYNNQKFTLTTNDNGTTDDLTDDTLVLTLEGSSSGGSGEGGGEGGGGEGGGKTKPDKPSDKPEGGGEGGGGEGGGGGTEETVTLTGALQLDSGEATYDGGEDGKTITSTTSDQNVVLAQNDSTLLTISHYTLKKTGDCSNEDNSNFFAVNAVVAAASSAMICIDNSTLDSEAKGANGLFATGEGSTIYAYNCTITSKGDSSRGLDATYEGTVIASKLTITTSGSHCGALATDRGNGYISVTDSTLSTAGQGSPLIYSTGVIEVKNVTGTATGAQIAGIEGLSTIRIKNSNLTGSGEKASEPIANGVIIYQSMSGDSTEGTATFEVADSTLTSAIDDGAMFYITNSSAVITVQNCTLAFDTANNYLLKAAGNDGEHGWGTAGENGANVVFTAIDQTLAGTVSVDGISFLDMYLIKSCYSGTFELDTTYTGNGGTDLFIDADSTWTVTGNCTLQSLTIESGAAIVDGSGKTVSIVSTSGKTLVSGSSDITVTVSTYATGDVEALHTIQDFEIDRTAFEEMYSEETVPTISTCETVGNTTAITWASSSENGTVDIALDYTASSDEKLFLRTDAQSVELYTVPGDYELSLKDAEGSEWSDASQISGTATENATAVVSNENSVADLFFANVVGTWDELYQAMHLGSINDWQGTGERVNLDGKNKIANTFTGSSDANILFLTDESNGDSLFVDDIYTAFPNDPQSRIAQLDEIRAGAGDDIVDMTSQNFEYVGDGLVVRGGSGDDTLWANKGSNQLFGDAGNDRLVGASGNDVIVGGIGDDSMHGGGGSDIFCFCENWGSDTVEQLSSGSVTLWFESGSEDYWISETMTYQDGENTVTVTGVSQVTLKFGDDGSEQYDSLVAAGCFMEESSDKIFETEQKGVLATL